MEMAAEDSADDAPGDEGPLRTCVVTRLQRPVEDLIRFVTGPDGSIVPDLACRLPGRGVWISLQKSIVETAVKTRAFNRSLKREVKADPELPALIDRLLAARSLAALSLTNKAGQVLTGFSKIDTAINEGSVWILLHGQGAGDDGVEKLDRRFKAMNRDVGRPPHIVTTFTIEQMSLALGRSNVVHAALKMGGAAEQFLVQAERLEKYRTETPKGE
jgi:predicted RNA-binding protein YlxR (DUF448 family)